MCGQLNKICVIVGVSGKYNGLLLLGFEPKGNALGSVSHGGSHDAKVPEIVGFMPRFLQMGEKELGLDPVSINIEQPAKVSGETSPAHNQKVSMPRFAVVLRSEKEGDEVSHMIRVSVCVEDHVHIVDGDTHLKESVQGSASGVDQDDLILRPNDRSWRATDERWDTCARA